MTSSIFFDPLKNQNSYQSGQNVLIVTHMVPYIMIRAAFEHLDEEQTLALGSVPNCGISEFVLDTSKKPEGRMRLVTFNHTVYS